VKTLTSISLLSLLLLGTLSTALAEDAAKPSGERPLAEAFRKCRENPNDTECVKRKEERRERFAALRQKCQETPTDEICLKMKERQENRRQIIASFCQEHSGDPRCNRSNEHQNGKGPV